ncbi:MULTISPECIES: chemotaxis protein CheW [Rhodomicrobium]|uniref:chemotaxis protein CheW n=1 Tax=Rhodomicrobium TaxID=1068 RepID=UPI000B4B216D|nr:MULTISPECIES: chemotaxis protein CheW [Rhodomicrobium]
MLFLLFQLDGHRYALDGREVVEILPLVTANRTPHSPEGSAGLFNYRGRPVPLIDLSEMVLGRPAKTRLSTRIILVERKGEGAEPRLVGLLAEQATELVRGDEASLAGADAAQSDTPYLRSIFFGKKGFVQRVDANALVSHHLGKARFGAAA